MLHSYSHIMDVHSKTDMEILLTNPQTIFKCHQFALLNIFLDWNPSRITYRVIVLPLGPPLIGTETTESLSATDGDDNDDKPLEFLAHP